MDQAQMLIIVDMLNDFCKPDGVLYCGDAVPEVIKNIENRLEAARSAKIPIIWLCDAHEENDEEFKKFPPHAVIGTWGSEIVDELAPVPESENEFVVEKTRYSGFYKTDLDNFLTIYNAHIVEILGVCTSICVMDTVGGLANRNITTVVRENCVTDFDSEAHSFSIKRMKNIYGAEII